MVTWYFNDNDNNINNKNNNTFLSCHKVITSRGGTDYRGHCRTILPVGVGDINLKACTLILIQIIQHRLGVECKQCQ